jgi:hypothetical protein
MCKHTQLLNRELTGRERDVNSIYWWRGAVATGRWVN